MPSDLPKVTTYLSHESFEALDAAATALGQSRSRLIAELVESSVPMLGVITDAARVLQTAGESQRAAMSKAADDLALVHTNVDALSAEVVRIIGAARGEK